MVVIRGCAMLLDRDIVAYDGDPHVYSFDFWQACAAYGQIEAVIACYDYGWRTLCCAAGKCGRQEPRAGFAANRRTGVETYYVGSRDHGNYVELD